MRLYSVQAHPRRRAGGTETGGHIGGVLSGDRGRPGCGGAGAPAPDCDRSQRLKTIPSSSSYKPHHQPKSTHGELPRNKPQEERPCRPQHTRSAVAPALVAGAPYRLSHRRKQHDRSCVVQRVSGLVSEKDRAALRGSGSVPAHLGLFPGTHRRPGAVQRHVAGDRLLHRQGGELHLLDMKGAMESNGMRLRSAPEDSGTWPGAAGSRRIR